MKVSDKVTFSIAISEVRQYVNQGNLSNKDFNQVVRQEMWQCIQGVINGDSPYSMREMLIIGLVEYSEELTLTDEGKKLIESIPFKLS